MAIKLTKKTATDDLSARMPLRLKVNGDVLTDDKGEEGWIEFWSEDALQIKAKLKLITGALYKLQLRQSKRSARELEAMSNDAAAKELDEFKRLSVEALAIRTKAWRLIDDTGVVHEDYPVTMENARDLYGDDEHDLSDVASAWLESNKDAFLPKKSESSSPSAKAK